MAAPPLLLAVLPLLLLSAFLPSPTAAVHSSNHKPFPPVTPLHLQQRVRSSLDAKYVTAAADGDSTAAAKPFTAHYYPQELDHFTFTPNSSMIFYQKYLLNDTFWRRPGGKQAGPLFVYTGNEGDIEWFATNTGFMFDIAPKFGALLVFIEHRFYGESKPFGNDSYKSPDKLGYLTSTQALADFAVLITSLKQNLSAEAAPVVVFGGSYGGMLASWFRLKYPHVALGALASSAPILQFDYITPWTSFYDAVSQDYKSESLNCFNVIKATWDMLEARGSNDTGLLELSKMFRACKTVKSVYSFRNWLWTAFTYTAMVDYPSPANFLENLPAYPVKEMCKIIDGFPASSDTVNKAFAAASLYYNYTGNETCFKFEEDDDPHGLSGWQWQKIDKVLMRFGSNIIFSNGMRDPWSRGGVLKNISSSIIALVTEKGAHHLDFRSETKDDPDWVIEQRRQEVQIIQGWIDQYNQDMVEMSS
ncbi:hypothetical protein PR202_gb28041 [Eleusine coracana subsp. coracana]|uniref:Lysosomal Pro-X carboxypeptidase n=1 Tax=Eleusine coracana subsp. coracana TaxID=191504 RepID=A0AAV5FWK9_ELECO|nr:hypothetical protein PR202_gb28041 [Eleusine coracana subsp. coracana]